ncbi:ATP-binding protein [Saccharothrix xinjiangensis]|uniref:ATP-binding protein n=1 Tax=Saccharothrix xinjiangensis TaxID=204798 RepID=A0ABV9YET7_9PSEU
MDDSGGPRPLALALAADVPPLVRVRRWAADALADLTDEELGDCMLVVTELVANAYDHGCVPRSVRLHRSDDPCCVHIEVDDGSVVEPTLGRSRLGPQRGRGLVIVDNLSKDWGTIRHEDGKTVWAQVPCGAPSLRSVPV